MTDVENASQSRRCAVIYNPTKISDKFRALVEEGVQRKGLGWGACVIRTQAWAAKPVPVLLLLAGTAPSGQWSGRLPNQP